MSLPQPTVALNNICSAIFNNTLYTYSSSAFQSLALTSGAKWKTLAYSESVTGGVCVGSTPADSSQAGFFVVGGTGVSPDYTGLQKYTYSTGQWSTLTPLSLVTQDRLYHGATYINSTDSILMYAGVQDGSKSASQETFTIGASAPYLVEAIPSTAPPTTNPMLLPWSDSAAVMIGGSTSNTAVMLFDTAKGGWYDSGATLLEPFTIGTSGLQTAIMTGDDGSKSLYTFDVTVSPNQVSRIVLMDGSGNAVTNAGPSKRSFEEEALAEEFVRRSSLTLSEWPAYNATLAPTTIRSGFSVAQGAGGMIVLSGGGGSDVICVFNGRTNAWRNATQMLSVQKTLVQTSSVSSSSSSSAHSSTAAPTTLLVAHSSSAAPSATATPATSSAAAVTDTTSHNLPTNAVLGIVLGGIAFIGIILISVYLILMRRRKRRNFLEAAHNRRASGTSSSEKDAFAIASDSFSQRPNGGGKGTFRAGHQAQDSQGSFSSVAILMGRVNQPRQPETTQKMSSSNMAPRRGSVGSLYNKGMKGTISRPIPQMQTNVSANAVPQYERSGPGIGAGAAAAATGSYGRSVTDSKQQQQQVQQANGQNGTRRSSGWNRYWSGGSALNMLGFGSGNNGQNSRNSKRTTVASDASSNYSTNNQNRITQDSATVPPLDIPGMPEAKPRFQRVNSGSPTISNYDNYLKDGMQGKIVRSTSQTSSHSGYSSGIPASVHDMWDPTSSSSDRPWGSERAPSSAYGSTVSQSTSLAPGGKKSYVPTGMSRQPQLAMADTSSDMSWLNLGDVNSRV
ncbi:hypothetical protein SBRCBS47491_009391 [Sporothrix bragantina]|uniref:Pre-mRNA splicing factor CLF1 n=1 Tax=Sporothrix bragantina TaxID=671064 RepID=A0ABP0CUC1_9PEZI